MGDSAVIQCVPISKSASSAVLVTRLSTRLWSLALVSRLWSLVSGLLPGLRLGLRVSLPRRAHRRSDRLVALAADADLLAVVFVPVSDARLRVARGAEEHDVRGVDRHLERQPSPL